MFRPFTVKVPVSHLYDHEETHTPCPCHRLSRCLPVTAFPDTKKRQIHRPQAPSGTQAEHSEHRWPAHPLWDPSSKAGAQVQSRATRDISEHPRAAHGNRDLQHEGELRRAPVQPSVFRELFGYRYCPQSMRTRRGIECPSYPHSSASTSINSSFPRARLQSLELPANNAS